MRRGKAGDAQKSFPFYFNSQLLKKQMKFGFPGQGEGFEEKDNNKQLGQQKYPGTKLTKNNKIIK